MLKVNARERTTFRKPTPLSGVPEHHVQKPSLGEEWTDPLEGGQGKAPPQ